MKILSISNIITNSSSEVFCYYDEYSDRRLRKLLATILKTLGIDKPVDEVFSITYYESDAAEEDGITLEEALKEREDAYGHPYIDGFRITSKDPKLEELCKELSVIDTIFEYEEVYN